MKTKLEMAHDYAIALLRSDSENMEFDKFIQLCWNYADSMQAEADKRVAEVAHKEEWQPDWGQAPNTANIWKKSSADNYYWYCGDICLGKAPSFGYTGDWRESLRKRPQ